jgi:hypothetical protein
MKKSMLALFRGYIVPSSSDTSLPAVPNYFLVGKSAKGRAGCCDGAVGVGTGSATPSDEH